MPKKASHRALKTELLLRLAIGMVALLAAGCHESNPVGVYTYSRAAGASRQNPAGADSGVTFILEIRANGSYVSTVESTIRDYKGAEGELPTGKGTWQIRDDNIILSSGGGEVARFIIEGLDLIDLNGTRYTRVRWLSSQAVPKRDRFLESWSAQQAADIRRNSAPRRVS